jgi:hypothetical protein
MHGAAAGFPTSPFGIGSLCMLHLTCLLHALLDHSPCTCSGFGAGTTFAAAAMGARWGAFGIRVFEGLMNQMPVA